MNLTKKVFLGLAVGFFANTAFSQSLAEGIVSIDSHKYAKAKQNFEAMLSANASAENYFYLGNTYLSQVDPDLTKAQEFFNKGLAKDSKSYLNKIGMASVKLGKGDKSAIMDIQNIVKDSKEKDAEVLYRAAEALTKFKEASNADLAITYLNKAIEKSKKDVPGYYYYTLGDAYNLKNIPGDAMSSYEKALPTAKNKASVYVRMANVWMQAKQWKLAKENIDKALKADPTYAPAYRASADYNTIGGLKVDATKDLLNYTKYADSDPYTQLDIAKLYYTAEDYANSKSTLDAIFDQISDPIKYKLRALQVYRLNKDYQAAKTNLDQFISKADRSRVLSSDNGFMGLLLAGLASTEKDASKKTAMLAEARQKIDASKAAKDSTFDWDVEFAKASGSAISQSEIDAGPTNEKIAGFKRTLAANPKDTDALFGLGNEYMEVKNWKGAVATWQNMSAVTPSWAPVYYNLGLSYRQLGNVDAAVASYEKYISTVKPADVESNKEVIATAYYNIANMLKTSNVSKAKDYVTKALALKPDLTDAVNLSKQLIK